MREYDYTAISPPQTNWEVGSIVELDARYDTAPVLRATAASAEAPLSVHQSSAPDVSKSHEAKLDMDLGVSIDAALKAKLAASGARRYSIVATGNQIRRVLIDQYAIDTFPAIAKRYGSRWAIPLAEDKLYYLYEVWCSAGLEYRFYGEGDARLELEPVVEIPAALEANYEWKNRETLGYVGPEQICLGYKARPIRLLESGEVIPHAAGGATPEARPAREDIWE